MKSIHILSTSPPTTDHLVPIPRLSQQWINLQKKHQMFWVNGPSGSGKTSSVAQHLNNQPDIPVYWFRLEHRDRDAALFFQRLHTAFSPLLGKYPKPAPFDDPLLSLKELLSSIASQLAENASFVWDNIELLSDNKTHIEALYDFSVQRKSSGLTFHISQSTLPEYLQANNEICCINPEDLRLTQVECGEIAGHLRNKPSNSKSAASLHRLSEGWIGPLAATIHAYPPTESSGSKLNPGHLLWQTLNTRDQKLALQLSLLPEITPALITSSMNSADAKRSHQLLAELPLVETTGNSTRIYRLHPLLLKTFTRKWHEMPELNRSDSTIAIAKTLTKENRFYDAGECYISAEEWPELHKLIKQRAETMLLDGSTQVLKHWIEMLPENVRSSDPWLCYWLGSCQRFDQPHQAWPLLETAFNQFRDCEDVLGQYSSWLAISESMALVFDDLHPLKQWLAEYDELRRRHPRCPDFPMRAKTATFAGVIMTLIAPKHPRLRTLIRFSEFCARMMPLKTPRLAMFSYLTFHYASTGQIARLHAQAKHLLPALDNPALPTPLRLLACSMVGLHQLIAGQETAEETLDGAILLSQSAAGGAFRSNPRAYRVYCDIMAGRNQQAQQGLKEFHELIRPGHRMDIAHHDFMSAWLAALSGDTAQALAQSEESKLLSADLAFDFGVALNTNLRAQLFAAIGNIPAAQEELQELKHLCNESGSHMLLVMHDISRAWLSLTESDIDSCTTYLQTAFTLAEQEGIYAYQGFIHFVVADLALFAAKKDMWSSYIQKLVSRWQLHPEKLSPLDDNWPWPLRIRALGHFEIIQNGTVLDLSLGKHKRPVELLSALIAEGGRDVAKWQLIDYLWPDTDADKSSHALDNLLHRLRKLLGAEAIEVNAGRVSLNPQYVWLDTWATHALKTVKLTDSDPITAMNHLMRWYRGRLFAGDESGWLLAPRESLHSSFLHLALKISDALLSHEQTKLAVELWEHTLQIDPMSEPIYEQLIRYHLDQGRSGEAMRIYQRCSRIFDQELGIAPGNAILTLVKEMTA
ncbi:MAG: BTAD domain-containing putative transcriptional regulator [Candidatus Thiodiazotropha sp. 6PLUC2]